MSRFTHHASSQQQQSCFCCSPVSSSSEERNRHVIVTSLTQYGHQTPVPSFNSSQDETNSITELISNFHLENQEIFDQRNDIAPSPLQHSPQVEAPQGPFCNLRINMRALQTRQLGMSWHNGHKVNAVSNIPVVHQEPRFSDVEGASSSIPKPVSTLNLDLVLDELGMLSTVTNSRREYLLETRSKKSAFSSREGKLQRKSESSPNLASLSWRNGFHIIQLDSKYVTNVSCDKDETSDQVPFSPSSAIVPSLSQSNRLEYRDPQRLEATAAANRRRSIPRMSRMRKDRYNRSRCPYQIPNRRCHSMQEADFRPDYSITCPGPFNSPVSSPGTSSNNPKTLEVSVSRYQSKSNGPSPAKLYPDQPFVRSHSVEDLSSVQRRLELVFAESDSQETEGLDQIATQLTDVHMS